MFQQLKTILAPDTPDVGVLCPTRWTVKADSLRSIVDNYLVLSKRWSEALDLVRDSETQSHIRGVAAHMADFDYFGVSVAETILQHCDNSSQTLQHIEMSAAEGQSVVALSLQCLKKLQTDEMFPLFWCKVTDRAAVWGWRNQIFLIDTRFQEGTKMVLHKLLTSLQLKSTIVRFIMNLWT